MYGGNVVGSSPTASLEKSTKCYTDFCPSKYEKSLENQGFFGTKSISYIKDGSPCWARTNDIVINSHALSLIGHLARGAQAGVC